MKKFTVKKLRKTLGISRKTLSHLLGVTPAAIAYYESQQRCPRTEIAYKIIDLAAKKNIKIRLEDLYPR